MYIQSSFTYVSLIIWEFHKVLSQGIRKLYYRFFTYEHNFKLSFLVIHRIKEQFRYSDLNVVFFYIYIFLNCTKKFLHASMLQDSSAMHLRRGIYNLTFHCLQSIKMDPFLSLFFFKFLKKVCAHSNLVLSFTSFVFVSWRFQSS